VKTAGRSVVVPSLTHGAAVFLVLALLAATGYVFVRAIEVMNPKRLHLEQLGGYVRVGRPLGSALQMLGPPDEERETRELIEACPEVPGTCGVEGPSPPPCTEFHTCVREYAWFENPSERAGLMLAICTDKDGVVRSARSSLAFDLRSW
jgi:hypothetical protein